LKPKVNELTPEDIFWKGGRLGRPSLNRVKELQEAAVAWRAGSVILALPLIVLEPYPAP
jgi:hypothetical protein